MDKEEIARRWPKAVALARDLRSVFGDGVRLLYAKNENGEELGKPSKRRDAMSPGHDSGHQGISGHHI